MGSVSAYDVRNYAQFNPLSMQEIFTPAAQMREQHDKLAEEYAAQEQAGGLSLLGLKEGIDDEAIKIHQNYMAEIKKAADELATKGFVEAGRRKNLYALKQQYNQNVIPLQNQLKIRQEMAEELRKIQLQDPTFRAAANPSEISLTTGLKNPEAFNYAGVSGNQLYSTAAKKLEQLSKTIERDIPEMIKNPKIKFDYFTLIQSGATPEQAAMAMKREGYDPTIVDKMTNMIHGTIDSTMREFGVYDKFKGNDRAINELWDSTSQAAYNAIGTKQFGQAHDSWDEYNAKKAQEMSDKQNLPGKQFLQYDPSFEKKDFEIIENNKKKLLNSISEIDRDIASRQFLVNIAGTKEDIKTLNLLKERKKSLKVEESNLQHEYFNFAKSTGIKIPRVKNNKMDMDEYKSFINSVSEKMKEEYKSKNKTRYFFNTKPETQQEFSSALNSMNKIIDVNGDKISKSDILENGKLKSPGVLKFGTNGMYLQIVDKDNNSKTIAWNPEYLGNPAMSSDYTLLMNIKNDSKSLNQKDFEVKYGIPFSKSKIAIENLTTKISNGLNSQYTQTKTENINPGYQEYIYEQ